MKKYLFSLACLLAVTSIQAQTFVTQTTEVPSRLYNSKATEFIVRDFFESSTGDPITVDIYDKNFNKKKSFQCDRLKDEYISRIGQTWVRGSELVINYIDTSRVVFKKVANYPNANDLYSALYDYYGSRFNYYKFYEVEDTIYGILDIYYNYFEYNTYEKKYPIDVDKFYKKYDDEERTDVWIEARTRYEYSYKYKGEWEMLETDTTYQIYSCVVPWDGFIDANTNFRGSPSFSADLLDNDASTYEYMVSVYHLGEFEEDTYSSMDRDGDGEIDYKKMVAKAELWGYDVYSDGKKAFSLDFGKAMIDDLSYIYVIDGIPYFMFYDGNVFRYDKNTTSLQNVVERAPFSIRKKSECVEVDLGRECEKQCEIVVTSVEGKTYMRQTVSAGTKNVNINTNRLASGIYNFSIIEDGKVVDNGKIIIR